MKHDLSPAVRSHIIKSLPDTLRVAYHRAMEKSMQLALDPNARIKFKKIEMRAMDAVNILTEKRLKQRRIKGLRPVRTENSKGTTFR